MSRLLIAFIVVGMLLIGIILFRSHRTDLNVTPDARQEIEKAKRR